jgi:apolipoprotein N-acyltransferase
MQLRPRIFILFFVMAAMAAAGSYWLSLDSTSPSTKAQVSPFITILGVALAASMFAVAIICSRGRVPPPKDGPEADYHESPD